jgi:hypothetical protein
VRLLVRDRRRREDQPPVSLPGTHGLFQPVATAENWDGGVAGARAISKVFAFANLAVRSDYEGAWQAFDLSRVLRDPAYELALRPSGRHRVFALLAPSAREGGAKGPDASCLYAHVRMCQPVRS